MQELIKNKEPETEPIEKVELRDWVKNGSNKIYLCQKNSTSQSILVKRNNEYVWLGFYLDQSKRTVYKTFEEAVESRFQKKYKVFVLNNKTELKQIINPQRRLF